MIIIGDEIMKEEKVTLIKPKKKKENYNQTIDFFKALIMLLLGILLLTKSTQLVTYVFYGIGVLCILVGIYYFIKYTQLKKQLNMEDSKQLMMGTLLIFIGILILLLAGTIENFIRFVIYNGLQNVLFSLQLKDYFNIVVGIILILMGLYTILATNIVLQIIGVLCIFSSISDFIKCLQKK